MRVRGRTLGVLFLVGLAVVGVGGAIDVPREIAGIATSEKPVLGQLPHGGPAASSDVRGFGSDTTGLDDFQPPARVPDAPQVGSEAPSLDDLQPVNVPLAHLAESQVPRTTGNLTAMFPNNSPQAWGSATVVHSENRDLIVSAAHLLINKRGERATNVVFVPAEHRGTKPYGEWSVRDWAVPDTFQPDSVGAQDDVAVVLLNTLGGEHIQDVLGSQGICFGCRHVGLVRVFAYRRGFEDGSALDTHCRINMDSSWVEQPEEYYGPCLDGQAELGRGSSGSGCSPTSTRPGSAP